jgi:L-amino acid N-acyltransferase YncA
MSTARAGGELPVDELTIRAARPRDAAAIAVIYNQGIEDRLATLETELRDAAERRRWLRSHDARHPVIVAEQGGEVLGWASLNVFNPRACYDRVADFSIYIRRDRRGRGLGERLLATLEERAAELGYHKLVLAALARNAAGRRLYTRRGFREVGVYREQGMLDGAWVDVLIMEKLLGSR